MLIRLARSLSPMRSSSAVILSIACVVALAPAASAAGFGHGPVAFDAYEAPDSLSDSNNAGEPTIGITWDTGHAFYQSFATTYRISWDNSTDGGPAAANWEDVTPAFTPINVDPMLHVDHSTNRIWAGGLAGACSLMGISDDDGSTWTPAGNMCNFAQFDHQSIGSGPWADSPLPRGAVYPRATYYCSQGQIIGFGGLNYVGTACSTSVNGGLTWLPPSQVLDGCSGLHGHIRVSEVTGTAAVPDQGCTSGEDQTPVVGTGPEQAGFGYTSDNGATWSSRVVPGAVTGDGFDPGLDFSKQSGWLYYAQADSLGVHVAMSKDEGAQWETLGANGTIPPATWYNLTALYKDADGNPIKYGAFAKVIAGDDDRAVVGFLATTNPEGKAPFNDCGSRSDDNVWFPFLAQTFDGGASWTVTRVSDDPIQVGAIWNGGGGDPCRNLLDFAGMDIDATGRIYFAWADGCTGSCSEKWAKHVAEGAAPPEGSDSRDAKALILRQSAGRGVFAANDDEREPTVINGTFTGTSSAETPGVEVSLVVGTLAGVAVVVARRRFGQV